MARRDLLNDDERQRLFGLPESEAELIRHYTLTPPAAARGGSARRPQPPWLRRAALPAAPPRLRPARWRPSCCWTTLPTKLACRRRHSGTIAAAPRPGLITPAR